MVDDKAIKKDLQDLLQEYEVVQDSVIEAAENYMEILLEGFAGNIPYFIYQEHMDKIRDDFYAPSAKHGKEFRDSLLEVPKTSPQNIEFLVEQAQVYGDMANMLNSQNALACRNISIMTITGIEGVEEKADNILSFIEFGRTEYSCLTGLCDEARDWTLKEKAACDELRKKVSALMDKMSEKGYLVSN